MARLPRNISIDEQGFYHLRGQISGPAGYYPLQKRENALFLISRIRLLTSFFFCQVASLSIMGNHYHLVLRFEAFRPLDRPTLEQIARLLYQHRSYRPYPRWKQPQWERFNRRLFNPSELMRNLHSDFATWFNRRYGRKGPLWAGRFSHSEVENLEEAVFYVELNAVRAHLVRRPEKWRYCSAWMRRHGQDDWLMPLSELMVEGKSPKQCRKLFWTRLYWRGTRPSKENDGLISLELAEQMEQEGFQRGCYLQSVPGFSRGRVIGSHRRIEEALDRERARGTYKRRRNPVYLGVGNLYQMREQRSNYVRV